ncbi:hypothetical protein SNE40_016438 [Patella caerulea]|uniref:Ig-like domain-containing protein n=1 Tax=Patella caerulea TaxID=87958 RepID=A0AAN8JD95_PATCE
MGWSSVLMATMMIASSGAVTYTLPMTYKADIQVEYFRGANLTCDSNMLNVSQNFNNIESIQWMLPDVSLITESTNTIKVIKRNMLAYTLMIDRVADDQFGYYTCIIVYKTTMVNENAEVKVVRWGLNINGPDFSKLRAEYARHAIVGAIAAGILLGVLGITCVIWHYRYNARKRRNEIKYAANASSEYNNKAYDDIDIEKEKSHNKSNGESADSVVIDEHM